MGEAIIFTTIMVLISFLVEFLIRKDKNKRGIK